MYGKRNKKIYSIALALCIILSVATSFLCDFQVNASESLSFDLESLSKLEHFTGKGSAFNYDLYSEGVASALQSNKYSEDVLKNTVSAIRNPFVNASDSLYSNLPDSFENVHTSIVFNDYGSGQVYNDLKAFCTSPEDFNYLVLCGNSSYSSNYTYYIFYSTGNLKSVVVNSSVYVYSDSTVYRMLVYSGLNNSADYRDITSYSANTLSNVLSNYKVLYSTCPIMLTYQDNNFQGDDYSTYSTENSIAQAVLVDGVSSPFLIDRRLLFSNFVPDTPSYDSSNDPLSQEFAGAWDIDVIPINDMFDGTLKVQFVPSQRLSESSTDVNVVYWFQLFFNAKRLNNAPIIGRATADAIGQLYNYSPGQVGQTSWYIQPYMTSKSQEFKYPVSNDYVDFNTATVLHSMSETTSYFYPPNGGGRKQTIDAYNQLKLYKNLDYFNTTSISNSAAAGFGGLSVGATAINAGITRCTLTVYARAYYGNQEITDIAYASYDYLTGNITKQGTVSSFNNTEITDDTVPSGFTPEEYDTATNDTINEINANGGSNNNSINNNPSIVINNNNTNNNNGGGYGYPDTPTEPPEEGALHDWWVVFENYKFIEWITGDIQDNEFIQFLFNQDLWSLPVFNLIIPALVLIIAISLASTILRFIRGQ